MKIRKALIYTSVAIFMLGTASINTEAKENMQYIINMVDNAAREAYKEWRYMIKDGKMYKRLYNLTTKEWEGDWIYVRDM